jgi:hypothetical protein
VFSKLEEIAEDLDNWNKGVGVAETIGGSVGIGGGVLMVAGAILLPFTGGASSVLIAGGAAAGTVGGVTAGVASVTGLIANKNFMGDAQKRTEDFVKKLQLISHIWENYEDSLEQAKTFSKKYEDDLKDVSKKLSCLLENNAGGSANHQVLIMSETSSFFLTDEEAK